MKLSFADVKGPDTDLTLNRSFFWNLLIDVLQKMRVVHQARFSENCVVVAGVPGLEHIFLGEVLPEVEHEVGSFPFFSCWK